MTVAPSRFADACIAARSVKVDRYIFCPRYAKPRAHVALWEDGSSPHAQQGNIEPQVTEWRPYEPHA